MTLGQVARMRYTVHAERHRLIIEFRVGTAIEAISKAWKVMGDAAAGVYIYDDEVDAAYWPDQFSELVQVIMSKQTAQDTKAAADVQFGQKSSRYPSNAATEVTPVMEV